LRALVAVPQLRRDPQLLARDARLRDRAADAHLVAVDGGGVDVAVADLERVAHDPLRLVRIHPEHPEAELGDRGAVVELDRGNRHALQPMAGGQTGAETLPPRACASTASRSS